ncbi:AAA family ATPase [Micromonospora sp. NPDC049230]|uniref:AAA family ATPase n=1 Tax=Micromonospora sp. NPDC049230 TaxID=3155502 RepID=UPI0033DFBE40
MSVAVNLPLDLDGPILTVLTGPAGIGRTHALRTVRDAAAQAGRPVLDLRLAPECRHDAGYLAGRILAALTPTPTRLAAGRGHALTGEPPSHALSRVLRRHPGLVLLVDDAQWADAESVEALRSVLHEVYPVPVRCVATVRADSVGADPDQVAAFDRLCQSGLVRIERLRPLSRADVDALARQALQATPHDSLSTRLRRLSRGVPAAVLAVVEGYRASAALRIVERRAYLTDATGAPRIPAEHDLTRPVRQLGPATHTVARALAVLEPLGAAVPELIGQALDTTPEQARQHLDALRAEGSVREDRRGWRIRVPALALALRAGLGPYERRRLAQVAVEALWSGTARCADPAYLPDQLAAAGGLVDAERAAALLRRHADDAAVRAPVAAARWWAGAADLSGDPADRAEAMLARAVAEFGIGRYAVAQAQVRHLLGEYAGLLPDAARQEAELLALASARGARAAPDVHAVAAGEPWLPDGPVPTRTTRAAALCFLDRWAEAASLLPADSTHSDSELLIGMPTTADTGGGPLADAPAGDGSAGGVPVAGALAGGVPVAGASAGDGSGLGGSVRGAARRRFADTVARVSLAAVVGALDRADSALTQAGLTVADLPAPERCLVHWRAGRWDAASDAALLAIAADLPVTRPVAHSTVHRAAAEILLARGWPVRARTLLDAARADAAPLPYLLAPVAAEAQWILGDPPAAERVVGDALAAATRHGLVVGLDELWLLAAEFAIERGDGGAARTAAESALATADQTTAIGALRVATAQLIVRPDRVRAGDLVALARIVGQPHEVARAIERVVRWTGRSVELLGEAYEILGDLGAILHRSRVRQAMRDHGITVPGRAQTLAEGERLLAALVAEGLSNRQLAAATQNSAKSIEGRLTRLFHRTGYRSRVELATAVLLGDYRIG